MIGKSQGVDAETPRLVLDGGRVPYGVPFRGECLRIERGARPAGLETGKRGASLPLGANTS